jgi:hypothetical protein
MQQKLRNSDNCVTVCLKFGQVLHSYLHPPSGADEATGESWQLVTTIHEGDGLILCG